ncbi:MAG: DUF1566 domain-containing protein [Terracidiphilus sp.]
MDNLTLFACKFRHSNTMLLGNVVNFGGEAASALDFHSVLGFQEDVSYRQFGAPIMFVLKSHVAVFTILFSLIVGCAQLCLAESSKIPTTWWPDPSTGLMWTGQSSFSLRGAMNWDDAGTYCSSLTLGGFSGWRLPTIAEMRSEEYLYPVTETDKDGFDQTVDYLGFKGKVQTTQATRIWTSSIAGDQQYFSVFMGPPDVFGILFKGQLKAALNPDRSEAHERVSKVSDRNAVLCVRPIDADILQLAQDAGVSHPVPDLLTLKANVPLNRARMAFQAQRYQDAIAQSQGALAIKPDLADAYWGIGISYGMLGQWDQAITNLESALKIDKGYGDAKDSLEWAKDNQKAVKHGKTAKDKPPLWK